MMIERARERRALRRCADAWQAHLAARTRRGVACAQHDMVLDDAAGATFRADLNDALEAIATQQSGSAAPGTLYPYQVWADTSTGILKRRNAANGAWIAIGTLDESFVLSRSSNTILDGSDVGKMIRATSSFTQTLTAAATLGDGWWIGYRIESGVTITFDPNTTEQIDGATTKAVSGPASGYIYCNGSAFYTTGFASQVAAAGLTVGALASGVTMVNGKIVCSRAAGAETIAIKTQAGADPSAADPVHFLFRDAAAGTGGYNLVSATAALSLTLSAGSTLGSVANQPLRLWLGVFNDGGTLRVTALNCLSGSDAAGWSVYALAVAGLGGAQAEGGAGGADSAQVAYAGAAVSAKAYVVVGYLEWSAGLATPGTWDTAPSGIQILTPGIALPGQPVQQRRTWITAASSTTTVMPADTSIPQLTEGAEFGTCAFTPAFAGNVLEYDARLHVAGSAGFTMVAAVFRDSTADALAAGATGTDSGGVLEQIGVAGQVLAAAASTTTFKLRAGPGSGGTLYTNQRTAGGQTLGGVFASHLEVREIQG